ncbi:hypothetical protein V501_08963 [Pseudogymnoascus sp. VKM F-4519 (FW-2642)]|nr:hypothetical protein V501_08963 [Pseudogymnoascus sp. VKM F-4519 (FW-2642)]
MTYSHEQATYTYIRAQPFSYPRTFPEDTQDTTILVGVGACADEEEEHQQQRLEVEKSRRSRCKQQSWPLGLSVPQQQIHRDAGNRPADADVTMAPRPPPKNPVGNFCKLYSVHYRVTSACVSFVRLFAADFTMEPRARAAKNRGQQNFTDQELQMLLYAHGDVPNSLPGTIRVLDEMLSDFIIELCFEADRPAQLAGRQKVKLEDFKFACRKDPLKLGKIEEVFERKAEIDAARKAVDVSDDKITKTGVENLVGEELGEADDDADTQIVGGKRGKYKKKEPKEPKE